MFFNDWDLILGSEMAKDYFVTLMRFLDSEYSTKSIVPLKREIFKALELTSYRNTKCVILGQDPYPNISDACGLAFSGRERIPVSLANIYQELVSDMKYNYPKTADLTKWAREGVLLLNTVLTCVEGRSGSHVGIGWERFTDTIIKVLNGKSTPVVFMLWGRFAKDKVKLITDDKKKVITSSHPARHSAHISFFGSKPFSRANEFLCQEGVEEINWRL